MNGFIWRLFALFSCLKVKAKHISLIPRGKKKFYLVKAEERECVRMQREKKEKKKTEDSFGRADSLGCVTFSHFCVLDSFFCARGHSCTWRELNVYECCRTISLRESLHHGMNVQEWANNLKQTLKQGEVKQSAVTWVTEEKKRRGNFLAEIPWSAVSQ